MLRLTCSGPCKTQELICGNLNLLQQIEKTVFRINFDLQRKDLHEQANRLLKLTRRAIVCRRPDGNR